MPRCCVRDEIVRTGRTLPYVRVGYDAYRVAATVYSTAGLSETPLGGHPATTTAE